ncbi:MAG: pitrilysin family protein [Longimicrobiales bacterium]
MTSAERVNEPPPGPIRDYHFPEVNSRTLDNCVRSVVCTAGDLPLVTAHVIVNAGAATESANQAGLALLTANSLEGGTTNRSGTQLAWDLEELGLELTTWTTWDATHVRVTTITDRIEGALALLADIVRNPAFPEGEVERIRDEQLAEIIQRGTEPRALADDMASRSIFAEGSPYRRSTYGEPDVLRCLTAVDATAFHHARMSPDATSVLLVGDVEASRGHDLVMRAFGDWGGKAAPVPQVEVRPGVHETSIRLIDRPGSVQSEVRIGHIGVPRTHPDHITLLVLNAILGGSFTSRLNLSLREKHGFTYGARSAFAARRHAGPFMISTAVGTDVTSRAVEEAFNEVHALLRDGPTDDEIANARNFLAGVFPLQLQSTEEIAERISDIVVYDLPIDYFQHYRADLLRVDSTSVRQAASLHIRPEEMAVVIVGDAAALRPTLEQLGIGKVTVDNLAPAPALAPADAE